MTATPLLGISHVHIPIGSHTASACLQFGIQESESLIRNNVMNELVRLGQYQGDYGHVTSPAHTSFYGILYIIPSIRLSCQN
jgi:hypothetical protein